MKNYYKNFFKSFNVVHFLLICLFFVGLGYVAENYYSFIYPDLASNLGLIGNDIIKSALYTFIPLCSLLGFNLLKKNKLTALDLIRNGLLVGTIGSFGIMLALEFTIAKCIILALSLVCLISQIIIRSKYVDEDGAIELGVKNYVCSLANKFNPLTIVLLGTVLGVVAIIILGSNKQNYNVYGTISPGILIGLCIIAGVILPSTNKDDANMVDALMVSFGIAAIILCSYLNDNVAISFKALCLAFGILGSIYLRAICYSGGVSQSSLKYNNYFKDLYNKYDVVLSIVLCGLVSVNILSENIIFPIISIAVGVVLLAGLLIFNKFDSKEVTLSDYFLTTMTMSSIMLIPVVLNFDFLMDNIINLVAVGINACLVVVSIVLNVIRLKNYGVTVIEENVEENVEETVEETMVVEVPVTLEATLDTVENNETLEEKAEEVSTTTEDTAVLEDEEDEDEEEAVEDEDTVEDVSEDGSGYLSIDNVNGLAGNKNVKRKFNTKLMLASDDAKYYYSEIKNYLQMYRANGRYSSRCETYRYKGIVAKVALAGKSIKVYLALDPSKVDANRYNFKDASDKKQYKEVPVMIKVKSSRGLKYFKELVDMMMAGRDVKPKRKYEPIDYTISLIPNGEAIFTELGVGDDYIYDTIHVKNIPSDLPDELGKFLPNIQGEKIEGDIVYATIHLDTLCNHFNDGDIIDMTVLKNLNLINRGNALRVKARGTLDRKLVIFADDFDADAVKMILCTNGTAVKVER